MSEPKDSTDLDKKYGGGEFSYLSWQCSLNHPGCESLHITSKFLGKVPVTKEQVVQLIGDTPVAIDPDSIDWVAEEWDTKNDGKVRVLRFTRYPWNMSVIHEALEELKSDDYPEYKPHITVPHDVWEIVKNNDSPEYIGPAQLGLRITDLVLKSQGKFVGIIETAYPEVTIP